MFKQVALLLVTTVLAAVAMHEDEAGKFDWHLRGVGVATLGALSPRSPNIKSIYIASTANVVASIRRVDGKLRWRVAFGANDTIACLVASAKGVRVVKRDGVSHLLDAASGSILDTYSFFPRQPLACLESLGDAGEFTLAFLTDAAVAVAKFDGKALVATSQENIVGTSTPVVVSALARASNVQMTRTTLFAIVDGRTLLGIGYNMPGDENKNKIYLTEADLLVTDAVLAFSSRNTTVVMSPSARTVRQFTLTKREMLISAVESTDFDLMNSNDGVVKMDVLNGLITFPGGARMSFDNSVPVRVLDTNDSSERVEILFRTRDGHLHFIDVSKAENVKPVRWERPDGRSDVAAVAFGGSVDPLVDKFGLNQRMFVLSNRGRVYCLTTQGQGEVLWSTDVFKLARPMIHSYLRLGKLVVDGDRLVVYLQTTSSRLNDAPQRVFLRTSDGSATEDVRLPAMELEGAASIRYTVDRARGIVEGTNATDKELLWRATIGARIEAVAYGAPLEIGSVEHLRAFPNTTIKAKEMRRKYPMANVVALAYYVTRPDNGLTYLTISAIEAVTGSVVATMRHSEAEGPVHLAVVDHMIIYHFFHTGKLKHYVGVWELFEHQDAFVLDSAMTSPALIVTSFLAKRRQFMPVATRPPLVASQLLSFPLGAVTAIGVTVTRQGIARKQVLFALASGRVYGIPAISFHIGINAGQPVQNPPIPEGVLLTPPTWALSHKLHVLGIEKLASGATPLESTSHVLAAGVDFFYTRASAGKPFDMLNDDFNKSALIAVCAGLVAIVFVVRGIAQRKTLSTIWA